MFNGVLFSSVIDAQPRMPRQPKLRSSCDGCGATKLKCDRGQPACGRCVSLDLVCVYGVSQKTGKPPRERLRPPVAPSTLSTFGGNAHADNHDRDRRNSSCSRGTGGFGYDDFVRNSSQIFHGHPTGPGMTVNSSDTTQNDTFRPLFPNFTTLDFDNPIFSNMDTRPMNTLANPASSSYVTPAPQTDVPQPQVEDSGYLENALLQPVDSKGHDCFREAYEILGSLACHRLNKLHSLSEPPSPGSGSITPSCASRVPLDQVLGLNREASERLGRLLTCSCAASPQLTMLYASIVSQILNWYSQAAGCTQGAPWNPSGMNLDTASASHQMPLTVSSPSSRSGSGVGLFTTWSSTAASTLSESRGKNTPALCQLPGPVAPAKMAIGTFDIDDMRVQTALNIQLLSGEMRRAGRLIDQFALHNFDGQCVTNQYTPGGLHSLYQSLDAWLRSEHSRIANMMKAKLRELNN